MTIGMRKNKIVSQKYLFTITCYFQKSPVGFSEEWIGNSEEVESSVEDRRFLSMGYEKDIFAVFAYEFELLHNRSFLVKSFAYAHGEIQAVLGWNLLRRWN